MANNHVKKGADVNKRNHDGDTTMEMNLLTNYFQKVISDRSTKRFTLINLQNFIEHNEKVFPDKVADKEVLKESEVAFCNKEGIYDVGSNWNFLQGASKIKSIAQIDRSFI